MRTVTPVRIFLSPHQSQYVSPWALATSNLPFVDWVELPVDQITVASNFCPVEEGRVEHVTV